MSRHLRTSDISRTFGVHPNTVRHYEVWGSLPPIPRGASGYRFFTARHLDQMRLARLAFSEPYAGRRIRRSAREIVRTADAGNLATGFNLAQKHQAIIRSEHKQTRAADAYLERWAAGPEIDSRVTPIYRRGIVAKMLDGTAETLRHWERNGLIFVPWDCDNNYRQYGPAEIGRFRVLRL